MGKKEKFIEFMKGAPRQAVRNRRAANELQIRIVGIVLVDAPDDEGKNLESALSQTAEWKQLNTYLKGGNPDAKKS